MNGKSIAGLGIDKRDEVTFFLEDGSKIGPFAFPNRGLDLSEPTLFFLKLCAAHDGVSERELLTRLICARCDAIGLQGLLDGGDVHAVPEFQRANVRRASAADEFRGDG